MDPWNDTEGSVPMATSQKPVCKGCILCAPSRTPTRKRQNCADREKSAITRPGRRDEQAEHGGVPGSETRLCDTDDGQVIIICANPQNVQRL